MITLRYLAMALLLCAVVFSGCSNEPQSEQAAVTRDAAPLGDETVASAESGELSPPSAGKRFKEQRMANAMRGLTYSSGRVVVDSAAVEPPADAEVFTSAGDAYQRGLYYLFEKNDRVAAIGALTRAVIMAPDDPDNLSSLGQALLRKGKREEAVAAFNTALDISPKHFEAQKQLAWAMQMGSDYESARQAWLRVIELDANDGEAHGRLAIVDYYRGDFESAWAGVHQARSLGYRMPAQFLPLLEEKMPEPAK